jgi:glycosyltransferase involved in cell wall biosynthesis
MPKISVVLSAYNAEKYIQEAVQSILEQSFRDFELIVINDGSTDKTSEILHSFCSKDSRIRLYERENRGLVYSLNEAITVAKAPVIARMDADDVALVDRLERQYAFYSDRNLILCGTHAYVVDELGKKVGVLDYPPSKNIARHTFFHNPFIHPSVMFSKSVFNKVGGYSSSFKDCEDYELWTRFLFEGKCSNLEEKLLLYRVHSGQITKNKHVSMVFRGIVVRLAFVIRAVSNFLG